MSTILIVEDDGLLAFEFKRVVEMTTTAVVVVAASSVRAKALLEITPSLDFAFLDVEVTDGTTFDLARALIERGVPLAFISGYDRSRLPLDLATAEFISKPCSFERVMRLLPADLKSARRSGPVSM